MFNANYIIRGKIKCLTGLHIGGSNNNIEIGGSDNVVIRDAINNLPYIPGSSLKGKIRSLLELNDEKTLQNVVENNGEPSNIGLIADVFGKSSDKSSYNINKEDEKKVSNKIREIEERIRKLENQNITDNEEKVEVSNNSQRFAKLIVRDAYPTTETIKNWEKNFNLIDGTELKYENTIDRVKGDSNPRNIERVPQDSEFDFEIVFGIYGDNDEEEYALEVYGLLNKGLKLLEDNYLGGSGSRGSGRIEITEKNVFKHGREYYEKDEKECEWDKVNKK